MQKKRGKCGKPFFFEKFNSGMIKVRNPLISGDTNKIGEFKII